MKSLVVFCGLLALVALTATAAKDGDFHLVIEQQQETPLLHIENLFAPRPLLRPSPSSSSPFNNPFFRLHRQLEQRTAMPFQGQSLLDNLVKNLFQAPSLMEDRQPHPFLIVTSTSEVENNGEEGEENDLVMKHVGEMFQNMESIMNQLVDNLEGGSRPRRPSPDSKPCPFQDACGSDAQRLCSTPFSQGDKQGLRTCMKEHEENLTPKCRSFISMLESMGKEHDEPVEDTAVPSPSLSSSLPLPTSAGMRLTDEPRMQEIMSSKKDQEEGDHPPPPPPSSHHKRPMEALHECLVDETGAAICGNEKTFLDQLLCIDSHKETLSEGCKHELNRPIFQCTKDAVSLCPHANGPHRLVKCLLRQENKVSDECKKALEEGRRHHDEEEKHHGGHHGHRKGEDEGEEDKEKHHDGHHGDEEGEEGEEKEHHGHHRRHHGHHERRHHHDERDEEGDGHKHHHGPPHPLIFIVGGVALVGLIVAGVVYRRRRNQNRRDVNIQNLEVEAAPVSAPVEPVVSSRPAPYVPPMYQPLLRQETAQSDQGSSRYPQI